MASMQSLVESKLDPKGRTGEEIVYACPNCENHEEGHHLQVNYRKGYFNCFKCEFGGKNLDKLLRKIGISTDFDYDILQSDYDKDLKEVLGMGEPTISRVEEEKSVDYSYDLDVATAWFYEHAQPLTPVALNYLINRGMTMTQILKLKLMQGVNRYGQKIHIKGIEYEGRNYGNRILVPSNRKDGRISFFVARDFTGLQTPKYLNPPKFIAYASEDVWNLDMVQSRFVIITEGVFTAITAGGEKAIAVATYGKSIADISNAEGVRVKSQGEKLLERGFDVYYLSYDADATEESLENAKYLADRGAKVKIVYIDPNIYGKKADANEIGYTEYLKCLANAYDYDRFLEIFL